MAACLLLFIPAAAAVAAPPQLTSVIPRGWKVGENTVTLQGAGLTPETQLLVDLPGVSVVPQAAEKPSATQLQFSVTLPAQAGPGVFPVRVANAEGISPALLVIVDQFANVDEREPNNERSQALPVVCPIAVEGRLSGAESDFFSFTGKRGDRFVAEIAARRLGCNVKPVLHLYAASGLEIALAHPARAIGGDARLAMILPDDGEYVLELHDLLYRGDNKQYRLLAGNLQFAEAVFPAGALRGGSAKVAFLGGNLSAAATQEVRIAVDETSPLVPLTLSPGGTSLPFPLLLANGQFPEVVEQPAADGAPQVLSIPGCVNGRIAQPNERDSYRIAVAEGDQLRAAVIAERLGSPLDGLLELRDDKGRVLASNDDAPGTADPEVNYTVPKDVTSILLTLTDANARGSDLHVYRLEVQRGATGGFDLDLLSPLVNVPAGGSASVQVRATRRNFDGPIELRLAGDVPAGVTLSGQVIGAGSTSLETYLSITAPDDAPLAARTLRILGEGKLSDSQTITVAARLALQPEFEGLPWLRNELPLAVAAQAPAALEFLKPDVVLVRGVDLDATLRVKRKEGMNGPIRLTAKIAQPAGGGRVAAAANQTIPADMSEGTIKLTVPANTTESPVVFVISGQLVDAKNNNSVLATVETAAIGTEIVFPFAIELGAVPELKPGSAASIPARLIRRGTFGAEVEVTVAGLPGTIKTAPVKVAADASEFAIPLTIAAEHKPGAVPNVKVIGTWKINPPLASPPLDLPLTVAP